MNPLKVAVANVRLHPAASLLFVIVIAVAVALGVGISAQERALRRGGAVAADRFDLLVAAPGSQAEIVLNTIFLRASAVELLDREVVARLLAEPSAEFVAPVGFGDSIDLYPVIGTIPRFIEHLSGGLADGRVFANESEAVIGVDVPYHHGDRLIPAHGMGPTARGEGHHHYELLVVGRMKRMGNPWDRAVVIPIEAVWEAHGLPTGHAEGGEHQIGPPFDPALVPGLPALVVKPKTVAAAYGLRSAYRTEKSMAFFPAEVLLQMYELLGSVRSIMSVMALVTQALVFLAIFAGVFALMKLFERQFAILRALGASRGYVFAAVWLFASFIAVSGVGVGLALGYVAASFASELIGSRIGVALEASLGRQEIILALSGAGAGILLATVPAAMLYRGSVANLLR